MTPVIPHFSSECLEELADKMEKTWPIAEEKFLTNKDVNIVIQINGKKKSLLKFKKDISEEELIAQVKNDEKIKKLLNNKNIIKSIFIKNKLINLIIK